jgi:hypothetical protein
MGEMFEGLSSKVLPCRQNQCLKRKDYQFPTAEDRNYFQGYILDCPHHGMKEWLLMQDFYYGLIPKTREHLDATAEGSFLSLTLGKAKILMDKIADNQS